MQAREVIVAPKNETKEHLQESPKPSKTIFAVAVYEKNMRSHQMSLKVLSFQLSLTDKGPVDCQTLLTARLNPCICHV